MSTLAAALSAQANRPQDPKCTIGKILEKLDDIDRQALLNAFDSDMEGESIAIALRTEGHHVAGQTVQRHRRGRCSCES